MQSRDTPALGEIWSSAARVVACSGSKRLFWNLRVPDEQAVSRHIREVQGPGFRHPHPGDGEQPKQRAVGLGT